MSENKSIRVRSGLSFSTALFLVFLVLKLTGVINWSWWFVTAPLWFGWACVLVIPLLVLAFGAVLTAGVFLMTFIFHLFKRRQ
jgi:hypothetical protein